MSDVGRGVVFDLGYKPHEGERLGQRGAIAAVVKDGVRRVLGIRRKARKKVIPWVLVAIAIIPAIVAVGLAIFLEGFAVDTPEALDHAGYFDTTSTIALLFTALAAPELLVPDRTQGVLAMYASRPLTTRDYLLARAGALSIVVLGFMLLPQVLLYVGKAAVSSDGFFPALGADVDVLGKVLVTALAFLATYATVAFVVAAFANRVSAAAAIFIGVMIGSNIMALILVETAAFAGSRWSALLAIANHPGVIRDWVFDTFTENPLSEADLPQVASLLAIIVLVVVGAFVVYRRYRRLV